MLLKRAATAAAVCLAGACAQGSGSGGDAADKVDVAVHALTSAPADAQCMHVIATRLSDFAVSQYQGPVDSASMKAAKGETSFTATAYPAPCNAEPSPAPWIADETIATLSPGQNNVKLTFHANTNVTLTPTFVDEAPPLALRPSSTVQLGRNGEGAAGPNYSLDGWMVKTLALPPIGAAGAGSEALLFSIEGKGGVPYTPRGLAVTSDGKFVFQVGEPTQTLFRFDGAGNFVEAWPVNYPSGMLVPDETDGLAAIDATHFVRTMFFNNPFNCDSSGNNCNQVGVEVLALQTAPDGSRFVQPAQQILLPPATGLSEEYVVGVAALSGGSFAITTLPATGTHLSVIGSDGSLQRGPVSVAGDCEGVFLAPDGRLMLLDYTGRLTAWDAATLAACPAETTGYPDGLGFPLPTRLTWDSARQHFIAFNSNAPAPALIAATSDFHATGPLAIDISGYQLLQGVAYKSDGDQLILADRIPPPGNNGLLRFDFYNLATNTLASSANVQGLPPARLWTLAYVGSTHQIVSHYRRPGNPLDTTFDAQVFLHNLDGTLAANFDLSPLVAVQRVLSVKWLQATDELAFFVVDDLGTTRLLVTDRTGTPHRSSRIDAFPSLIDFAPISDGPLAGDLGLIANQPSLFARGFLQ